MNLSPDLIRRMDAYFRAANYLSAGQIYLFENPLLREPLKKEHVKPRLLGHWGTCPGISFVNVHLNQMIRRHDQDTLFIVGPGHGAPAVLAHAYMEGTYTELFPNITQDLAGLRAFFKQFSFPGGIPSHSGAETPGSIHEGGELGYALSHAFGAAFDNPNLLVATIVGDGEAESGPLAASWHSNKYANAAKDGTVLPILHLNGAKIAGPTFFARIPEEELGQFMTGCGWSPIFVTGNDAHALHGAMSDALERAITEIKTAKENARAGKVTRPKWPMIVLRTPKGWTGPRELDGLPVEGTFRSHQVPIADVSKPEHLAALERWLRSYKPEELFDEEGKLAIDTSDLVPRAERRMSANPHANGGVLLRDLEMPDFRKYAVKVEQPGATIAEATRVQGAFIRDVMKENPQNFRVVSPDETASNRWGAVFETTDRVFAAQIDPAIDVHLAPEGRVLEVLSEHQCQGWLEGYILTGRHGWFSCYEAFIHIVDSMFNQHAKWLKVSRHVRWRRPISSLNYLLTSHVWRQDHNGFSHQDPGFIDHVVNKKASIIRVYLPPDANTLLYVSDVCMKSRDCVNVVVAGKQPSPQWLNMDQAVKHASAGIGIWEFASTDKGREPDVVMGCAGDIPTIETLAAVKILHEHFPELAIRVINVVDLMKLQPASEHPHGLSDRDFDTLFTTNKPIIFAFHGYPWLIHRLTYRRTNHGNLHVRGYKEEGTTTTPFDMTVLNDLDRFHLAQDAVDRLKLGARAAYFKQWVRDRLVDHKTYIHEHGEDMPAIRDWKWTPLA